MGAAGLRAICGIVIGLALLADGGSAAAGSRLYDMNRLLSQPHPYQTQRSVAPVPRAASRNTVPLPGSQYRLNAIAPPGNASPAYRSMRPVVSPSVPVGPVLARSASAKMPARPLVQAGNSRRSVISELVAGGFVHDPGQDNNEANTFDLNLEIIFRKVAFADFENRYLRFLFSPNPVLGGTINSDNETHTVYLALNWQHRFENDIFIGGSFGFTYHTGNLDQAEEDCPAGTTCSLPGNRRFVDTGDVTLGSRILFRESVEFGYWFAQRHGVSIYFAHMSNASLFDEDNDGMNFVGLRYRYSFD